MIVRNRIVNFQRLYSLESRKKVGSIHRYTTGYESISIRAATEDSRWNCAILGAEVKQRSAYFTAKQDHQNQLNGQQQGQHDQKPLPEIPQRVPRLCNVRAPSWSQQACNVPRGSRMGQERPLAGPDALEDHRKLQEDAGWQRGCIAKHVYQKGIVWRFEEAKSWASNDTITLHLATSRWKRTISCSISLVRLLSKQNR